MLEPDDTASLAKAPAWERGSLILRLRWNGRIARSDPTSSIGQVRSATALTANGGCCRESTIDGCELASGPRASWAWQGAVVSGRSKGSFCREVHCSAERGNHVPLRAFGAAQALWRHACHGAERRRDHCLPAQAIRAAPEVRRRDVRRRRHSLVLRLGEPRQGGTVGRDGDAARAVRRTRHQGREPLGRRNPHRQRRQTGRPRPFSRKNAGGTRSLHVPTGGGSISSPRRHRCALFVWRATGSLPGAASPALCRARAT